MNNYEYKVGDVVIVTRSDEEMTEYFYVGDIVTLDHQDKDGDWWAVNPRHNEEGQDPDGDMAGTDWCIGGATEHYIDFELVKEVAE